jgi:hypothetical protein
MVFEKISLFVMYSPQTRLLKDKQIAIFPGSTKKEVMSSSSHISFLDFLHSFARKEGEADISPFYFLPHARKSYRLDKTEGH